MPGTLFVVATPIGNLDDITLRALRVLREVPLIAAEDTRRTAHLLVRHGIATSTTSLHEHNEQQKSSALIRHLVGGQDLALVSDAGTPTISDPGARLVRAAIESGIRVEPVPGPNAAIAALSASGLIADEFVFLGFPPTRLKDRKVWLDRVAAIGGVVVFYEAPHRIERTLADLVERVGDRTGLLARELTKTHEQLVIGPISSLVTRLSSTKGEFTVILDVGAPRQDMSSIGQSTENVAVSRRSMVAKFAAELGVPANDLYRAVEKLRDIGSMTNKE